MNDKEQKARPFGFWSAVGLVIANMIGAGVFTTSGYSLASLENREHVMYAWLLGGLIAICGAICYGRLASQITDSGGEYLFLTRLVHPSAGFIAGWVSLLAGFTGAIAFAAVTLESYAIPENIMPQWLKPGMLGIAAIIVFGLLHGLVVAKGVVTQNVVIAIKILLLVGFIGYAFFCFPTGWQGMQVKLPSEGTNSPSVYGIASTLVWISLSFSGFNAAVYISGEVSKPEKNVPRALLAATLLVTVFYLILNFVFLYGPSPEAISGQADVAAIASKSIGGSSLSLVVRIIVCIALLSSISSMIIAGPRVYAKMAEDGVFPKWLKPSRRGRLDVPISSIVMQVGLACLVVAFSSLEDLLDYLGFTISVSAALTVACVFWAHRKKQEASTSAKGYIFYWIVAAIYISATLGLAGISLVNRPQQLYGFAATVTSGLVLYWIGRRRSSRSLRLVKSAKAD